jgi:hypothetical protein
MPAHISLPHQVLSHPVQSHFCLAEPHMSSALPGLGYEKADRISCSEFLYSLVFDRMNTPPRQAGTISPERRNAMALASAPAFLNFLNAHQIHVMNHANT